MNSNLLRGKRAEHGISQEVVADMLGISRPTYSFKEKGDREFTNLELRKLSKALSLSMNEVNAIFFGNELT